MESFPKRAQVNLLAEWYVKFRMPGSDFEPLTDFLDVDASRARTERLASELAAATSALARLRRDYTALERSKFSRLRTLWLLFKGLLGAGGKGDLFLAKNSPFVRAASLEPESLSFAPGYADVIAAFAARGSDADRKAPSVSIIIPVYNNLPVTMRCLMSIAQTWFGERTVEIIVVDDCSMDESYAVLSRIPEITVLKNDTNQGFVRTCNRGAEAASGEFIVFLNNDTEVRDAGWLEHLVRAAEGDLVVGAVGSKLIYPDGRLQEAGGIIWSDADGWNYGRLQDPQDPEYNFVREVDYCSGASLLVRAAAFRNLGGFNEEFAPAYYEDVDLCFALRKAGYSVIYEPRSEVIHYEGITSGTDIASGTKRFQAINRRKFAKRWAKELSNHFRPDPSNVYLAARRLIGKKTITVIDTHVPMHDRDAGSLRLFEIIKILCEESYRVVFLPDNLARIEPYCSHLQELGVEVIYHVEGSKTTRERILEAFASSDVAWISRPDLCKKWSLSFRHHPHVRVLYDTVDLHHVRERREAELANGHGSTAWRRVQALELGCARRAHATITVTEDERATLEAEDIKHVYVVPTIHNARVSKPRDFHQTSGLLFIGGYGHPPNVDAALTLCNEIMPIVRRTLPDVQVTLLGNNPPSEVLALASNDVAVPGFIPDVEPYFLSHRIFVAPLRFGAGHKGKIGHSLSYGLPIVTTAVGAEGYHLSDGIDYLKAETVSEFAQAIVQLYSDAALWSRFSENSIRSLSPFSSQAVRKALREVIEAKALHLGSAPARRI